MPEFGLEERYRELYARRMNGERIPSDQRISLREALTSKDLSVLVQQTVIDQMRDAAEPLYVGSKFLNRVRLTEGRSIIFPSIGAMRAHEVPEGAPYPEENPEVQLHQAQVEVKVQKYGLMVAVTQEMLDESQWDVMGVLFKKAGEAMARIQEERIFLEFSRHGHVVKDGDFVEHAEIDDNQEVRWKSGYTPPEGIDTGIVPTGRDFQGNLNGTLSVEDTFDMFLNLYANEYIATDAVLHPLVWPMVAKNEVLSSLPIGAFGGRGNNNEPNTITITPEQVQGRLPIALQITLTPFARLNWAEKKFDMYVVARGDVGALVVKDDMSFEQWIDPNVEVHRVKVRARWGIGIFDQGKAISLARNIRLAKSYPLPARVMTI